MLLLFLSFLNRNQEFVGTSVSRPAAAPVPPATGVITTARDSHSPVKSFTTSGDARLRSAAPTLEEALSFTSRLPYALRLSVVHATGRDMAVRQLSVEQVEILRAFVASPLRSEGLSLGQTRALKNDVLNVLCLVPGEEAETATMLRALYADPAQDAVLRDYALQHLVGLAERNPDFGWSSHWDAIASDNPSLVATSLIHLSLRQRRGELTPVEDSHVKAAALRLAANTEAKDPARATAIQVCGRLKLIEARELAYEISRSGDASMPLRIASVATLGDLGDDSATREYLVSLLTGPEKRLRLPARSALQRLLDRSEIAAPESSHAVSSFHASVSGAH